MSFRASRSSGAPSSSFIRASQDQDFDPFAAQGSSRRPPSAISTVSSSRSALAEETNSPLATMKRSRSQVEMSQARGLKRAPSASQEFPLPSPTRTDSQHSSSTSKGNHRAKYPASAREQSTSPSKRVRLERTNSHMTNGTSPSPGGRRTAGHVVNSDGEIEEDEEEGEEVIDRAEAAPESLIPAEFDSANSAEQNTRKRRSADKYLPGAIRRIALFNFLTYDSVEFRVGPYLNLICGPNGTGKSSIACAIALGLGGHPSLLGRASNLGSFVKRGESDGWIEIELQAFHGKPNPVIRRTLTTSNNKSDWTVNGRLTTKTDVLAMVSEYDIDVSNLCSFLPQDKVHEFAKMTDAKRLVETEKAVGGAKLVRWHEKLNECGKTAAEIANQLRGKQEQKAHLEQRNQALQVDVQRFEERQEIEQRIERLEVMIAVADYNRTKQNVTDLRQERDLKRLELTRAVERSAPARQKRKDLEDKTAKLKLELGRLDNVYSSDEKKRRTLVRSVEEIGRDIEAKLSEVGQLTRQDQDRARRVQELRKEIADRSAQLGEEPGVQDTAEIEAEMRSKREKLGDCHTRRGDIQRQIQEVNIDSHTIDKTTDNCRQRLAQLDNVPQQRLELLRNADQGVYKAVLWLRENQHRFRKPVHEPVLLEISLKDPKYTAAVEASIAWPILKTFVCQTAEDYDLMNREVNDRMKLHVTVGSVEDFSPRLLEPIVPRDQLAAFGFEDYAINLIDGPPAVLAHLCKQSYFNLLPVTLSPNADVERIEQCDLWKRFVASGEYFTVNVSRYGNNARQTMSRRIKPARSLVNSIDRGRQRQLTTQIQELSAQKKELEAKTLQLLKEDKTIQAEMARLEQEINDLKAAKRDRVGAQRTWEKESALIENRRRELKDKERAPSAEEKRARLMKEVRKMAQRRSQKMEDLCAQTVQMSKVADRKHVASLRKWQWDATATVLENRVRDLEEVERELAATLEDAVKAYTQAMRQAKELHEQVQRLIYEARELVAELDLDDEEQLDLDRLNAELRGEQSKLELAEGVRPEVIDQFRERQREIASMTSDINDLTELQTKTTDKIESLRSRWEPTLRSVIGAVSKQFSKAFDDMGLAGELRIVEDADFEKWKLEIMVKFRNAEELAPLSAQHQSGGERTLSTIMYVMSLLQLSRSPFTLVDEINQGMDPTAERVTHNHIVALTCQPHASQYFLITPKLLPDLAVHELQKVLLVNNGVYGERGFNFSKVHEAKKKAMGMVSGRLESVARVMQTVWDATGLNGEVHGLVGSGRVRSRSRSIRR